MAFIARFRWMTGVLADYKACRRVACENVADAQREGLDYVELRFIALDIRREGSQVWRRFSRDPAASPDYCSQMVRLVRERPDCHPHAPLALDEIIACLKRIRKSIEHWNRRGGRQGYLNFASQFVVRERAAQTPITPEVTVG